MSRWTNAEKLECWKMFLFCDMADNLTLAPKMAKKFDRSMDSCSSMIWKLFHRGKEKVPYWHREENINVCLDMNRVEHDWTPQEDLILKEAMSEMVPARRMAQLFGRTEAEVSQRIDHLKSAGRRTLMEAFANDNAP